MNLVPRIIYETELDISLRVVLLEFNLKCFNLSQKMPYRKKGTAIIEEVFKGRMVSAHVVESMHTLDGGVCKALLCRMIDTARMGPMSQSGMKIVNKRFKDIAESWPSEFSRSLRLMFQARCMFRDALCSRLLLHIHSMAY